MSTAEFTGGHIDATGPTAPQGVPPTSGRRFHRVQVVRRQQGVSMRRAARHMRRDMRDLKVQEEETSDMLLSELYAWQRVLDVPVAELLVDNDGSLSPPVLERARLVKLMKTAAALLDKADNPSIRRLTQTLIDQLTEIMPELRGVSPWHAVGQRRTLDEFGRAVERGMNVPWWAES